MRIGLIGAGAAGAAATHVLDSAVPDAEITVLEKSGGVCGRAATRRRDQITYDYGANYVKDSDEQVAGLLTETLSTDGLVSIDDPIYVFDSDGTVSEGRENTHEKWTYRDGLTQIAKRLFARTDATVHRRTRVEKINRDDAWHLVDDTGDTWGPFDVLLCSPPGPQTADLLHSGNWDDPLCNSLVDTARDVDYRTVWTAVLGYESELSVPYYALVNPEKDHEVGWVSREECKPGHVPEGESVLIVQANHEWSVDHLEDAPDDVVDGLAGLTADIVGEQRLADPAWSDHQRWRYAIPNEAVDTEQVEQAAAHGLYLLGDWVAGDGRVHLALRNGLQTGEQVAEEH